MTTFQVISIPVCLLLTVFSISPRRTLLSRRQGFFWAFLWGTAALAIALPNIANRVAHLFGIGRGADLVLYVLCFSSILTVRYFYHKQRSLEVVLTELVRREAVCGAIRRPDTTHV